MNSRRVCIRSGWLAAAGQAHARAENREPAEAVGEPQNTQAIHPEHPCQAERLEQDRRRIRKPSAAFENSTSHQVA
jgi:hypothetical protein